MPPWLVLGLGLALTAISVTSLVANGRTRDRARFERAAESARQRVVGRLEVYIALLRSTAGLLAVDSAVGRGEFARYAERLRVREHYPGIQGLGLGLRFTPPELDGLERRMRADGLPSFRVQPRTPRAEHYVITHLEPLDRRNREALGFDMYSEPVRRVAMDRARDTGEPAMTRRVTLVQEIDAAPQAGFLIYVPIYRGETRPRDTTARRRAILGFAYAPFRADDLFRGIFTTHAPDVDLRIYDGDTLARDRMLHDSRVPVSGGVRPPALADTLAVDIAGQRWSLIATPARGFARSANYLLAVVAAVAGLTVSLVLFLLARARHTATAEVAQARDLLAQVLEQAPVAICVLRGPEHVFELANPRYRELVSRDPIGLPLRHVVPEAEGAGLRAVLDDVYRTGRPWVGHGIELSYDRRGTGERTPAYFNVLYHPFTGSGGRATGVIAVAVEVTAEVRAQRDAELARQEAEHANRAKSDFLAAMSHELRTPLNAISGYVQLLDLEIHGPISAPQREALQRIRRSAGHLLSLINDVLNFAKLEAGRVEFVLEDVALATTVRDVSQMIEPQLAARGLHCRIDVPDDVRVRADAEKLRQILLNLLSNAVKFTERGTITVDVTPAPRDEVVRLHVSDTGVGIPEDRLAAIFDPFVQVNRGLSTPADGTGLGLAISRDLAIGMGAELTVRSAVGEGSTFTLTLPRAG